MLEKELDIGRLVITEVDEKSSPESPEVVNIMGEIICSDAPQKDCDTVFYHNS